MGSIVLQPLQFPSTEICTNEAMYFRRDGKASSFSLSEKVIQFSDKGTASFDTYFNSFSMHKWLKYTELQLLTLRIKVCGSFRVTLYNQDYTNASLIRTLLLSKLIDAEEPQEFEFEYPIQQRKGMYSFVLEAWGGAATFYGGAYVTNCPVENQKDVAIALNICTFHREKYVERNMKMLKKSILENEKSPLKDKLHIYLTDNGETLKVKDFAHPHIHLATQKGFGSSGGFAGGQLRILADKEQYQYTHMIYMDDDVLLDPQVLERTYAFLSLLKDEYKDALLGGALLHLDHQHMQIESGAQWMDGKIVGTKPLLDLSRPDFIAFNEICERINYQGWWFCCVPLLDGNEKDLPMPLYFHRDDVEFGLRHSKFISINGICIWHEPFENKPNSYSKYYDFRNMPIVNSLHCHNYKKSNFKKDVFRAVANEVFCYRYRDAELILQGAEDFCKGVNWVLQNDGNNLLQSLVRKGYTPENLDKSPIPLNMQQYCENLHRFYAKPKWKKLLYIIAGFLLPAYVDITVPAFKPSIYCFYRVKRALNFDSVTGKGFVTEKSYGETLRLLRKTIYVRFLINCKFNVAAKEWGTSGSELKRASFWTEHLKT